MKCFLIKKFKDSTTLLDVLILQLEKAPTIIEGFAF